MNTTKLWKAINAVLIALLVATSLSIIFPAPVWAQEMVTVSGSVSMDANGKGGKEDGEPNLAGYMVVARNLDTGAVYEAPSGIWNYQISLPPQGRYEFSISNLENWLIPTGIYPQEVTITSGSQPEVNFTVMVDKQKLVEYPYSHAMDTKIEKTQMGPQWLPHNGGVQMSPPIKGEKIVYTANDSTDKMWIYLQLIRQEDGTCINTIYLLFNQYLDGELVVNPLSEHEFYEVMFPIQEPDRDAKTREVLGELGWSEGMRMFFWNSNDWIDPVPCDFPNPPTPTPDPTNEPTAEPTDPVTLEPTDEPTAEPTGTPVPDGPVVIPSGPYVIDRDLGVLPEKGNYSHTDGRQFAPAENEQNAYYPQELFEGNDDVDQIGASQNFDQFACQDQGLFGFHTRWVKEPDMPESIRALFDMIGWVRIPEPEPNIWFKLGSFSYWSLTELLWCGSPGDAPDYVVDFNPSIVPAGLNPNQSEAGPQYVPGRRLTDNGFVTEAVKISDNAWDYVRRNPSEVVEQWSCPVDNTTGMYTMYTPLGEISGVPGINVNMLRNLGYVDVGRDMARDFFKLEHVDYLALNKPIQCRFVEAPTPEPTEEPTAEPTEEPTSAPTEEPTQAPTDEPTEEPTEEPVKTIIGGKSYFDVNNDCVHQIGEPLLVSSVIFLNGDKSNSTVQRDGENDTYQFVVQPGVKHRVEVDLTTVDPFLVPACPNPPVLEYTPQEGEEYYQLHFGFQLDPRINCEFVANLDDPNVTRWPVLEEVKYVAQPDGKHLEVRGDDIVTQIIDEPQFSVWVQCFCPEGGGEGVQTIFVIFKYRPGEYLKQFDAQTDDTKPFTLFSLEKFGIRFPHTDAIAWNAPNLLCEEKPEVYNLWLALVMKELPQGGGEEPPPTPTAEPTPEPRTDCKVVGRKDPEDSTSLITPCSEEALDGDGDWGDGRVAFKNIQVEGNYSLTLRQPYSDNESEWGCSAALNVAGPTQLSVITDFREFRRVDMPQIHSRAWGVLPGGYTYQVNNIGQNVPGQDPPELEIVIGNPDANSQTYKWSELHNGLDVGSVHIKSIIYEVDDNAGPTRDEKGFVIHVPGWDRDNPDWSVEIYLVQETRKSNELRVQGLVDISLRNIPVRLLEQIGGYFGVAYRTDRIGDPNAFAQSCP